MIKIERKWYCESCHSICKHDVRFETPKTRSFTISCKCKNNSFKKYSLKYYHDNTCLDVKYNLTTDSNGYLKWYFNPQEYAHIELLGLGDFNELPTFCMAFRFKNTEPFVFNTDAENPSNIKAWFYGVVFKDATFNMFFKEKILRGYVEIWRNGVSKNENKKV